MRKSVIDTIVDSGLIEKDAYIIVGLSGGPDSLCLLHALLQIGDAYNLSIVPVHVNHRLRPSAGDEADHVARLCARFGMECNIFETDVQEAANDFGVSTEEAGRMLRYEIFDDVANDIHSQGVPTENIFIAVAHNADDQSETVLFRLLRGTGIHGLAGIPETRSSDEGYMIIRPLLKVTREEIEAYIKANNLKANIDESNSTSDYTRNRIRNELIPYLEKNYNPNIKDALRRYAEIADVDDSVMTDIAYNECSENLHVNQDDNVVTLDITDIKDNPPGINRRIVAIVFRSLRIDDNSSYELVLAILRMIYSDNPSAVYDLPAGYKAIRVYNTIYFTDNEKYFGIAEPEDDLSLMTQVIMMKEFSMPDDASCAAFDFDKFNAAYPGRIGDIVLRTRREGDYIAIKDGSKKIQDFFVDTKVRKAARDSLLMACIDNEVLWILPNQELGTPEQQEKGKFSQNFQIDNTSERALFLEVTENLC